MMAAVAGFFSWLMKRWMAATFVVFGVALLLTLSIHRRPDAPVKVQALQIQPSGSESSNNTPIPVERPVEAAIETYDLRATEDLVPAGTKPRIARVSLETASGPEVGPGLTPGTVLQNMRGVIRDYNGRFSGNPFGNNREITAKLNGGNLNQIVFLKPEDGMRINDRGELIDNWGTPFFFHQISGNEMEIRSAGADRRLWTRDDLVIK
jgi:hypothetical protein